MSAPRTILHVDLDAFFASVEQRDDPSLRGKPVVVGGSARRGVVCAASYEARTFGVTSAMPMAIALRLCPQAIVVKIHMDRYAEASRQFFAILADYSPAVEALSFDEAFLDLTGTERLFGPPRQVATLIKARVRAELSLVASVGVAPIKMAAKIASDIDKPDGLRVVEPADLLGFMHPLPVGRLYGVGAVTLESLRAIGLHTIGDVARYPEASLCARLGAGTGRELASLARGEDWRPVESERAPVSIGHQETFDDDLWERGDLEIVLLHQIDRVAERLRRAGLRATVVAVVIKHDLADRRGAPAGSSSVRSGSSAVLDRGGSTGSSGSRDPSAASDGRGSSGATGTGRYGAPAGKPAFRQLTRRHTLPDPTSDARVIARIAFALLDQFDLADRPGHRARLCGVFASGLEARDAPRQLGLDEAARARGERLGDTLDKLRDKFGKAVVQRAVHLDDD